jgi:ABC-type transport system substrate-binding protein
MMTRSTHTYTRRQALRTIVGVAGVSLLAACAPAAPAPSKPAETKPAAPAAAATSAPAKTATDAKPAADPKPAAQAPPVPKPADTPVRGGSIVIAQDTDPIHLEVQMKVGVPSAQATEHMYDSLTVFDEKMQVQPSLAERWETPDPTTYIFHLRKGVKWHNGREFVADDVAYWHQRVLDPKIGATQRGNWAVITQVDIIDSHTVKMSLSKPSASLLALFATMRESAIPNKETVEANGDLSSVAVGTGPYKLAEFVSGVTSATSATRTTG